MKKYKRGKHPNSRNGFKEGHPDYNTPESTEKSRQKLLGREITWRDKIGKGNSGKVRSLSVRKKWSIAAIRRWARGDGSGFQRGANNPSWNGGTSYELYGTEWTEALRRSIRERDYYTCQLCDKPQGDRAFPVHHTDYDKKNCDSSNLVTLCGKCYSNTNKNRTHWIEYFQRLLAQKSNECSIKYSLFIGRWQCIPTHEGHIALIETVLKQGKKALIAIRNTEIDESNPFTVEQRKKELASTFKKWGDRVKIIEIPDIEEIVYGRKVGYGIREIHLSTDLESISGTKIRKAQKENRLWTDIKI